jgi:hypothetical protein
VGCRRKDIGRTRQQLAQGGRVAPARQFDRLDSGLVAQTRPVRSRAQRRVRLAFVDECQAQRPDLLVNHAPRVDVGYRDVERVAEMPQPLAGEHGGDRQEIVAVLERQMRGAAVAAFPAEPLDEEALLCPAPVGEITAEERPQRAVRLKPVIEPVDERSDRGRASDAAEDIATDESAVRLRVSKESTVLHRALASVWSRGG